MTLAYLTIAAFLIAISSSAEERVSYQMPPRAIADIADAEPTPGVVLDPTKRWLLVLERASLGSIDELSQTEHRLAGLRIHPATNAQSRRRVAENVALISVADGTKRAVAGLPENPRIDHAAFSPDGTRIAFTQATSSGLELWTVDVSSGRATRILDGVHVNGVFRDRPFQWLSSGGLIVKTVPRERGAAPVASVVPHGPIVQESSGQRSPARTYQDLLQSAHDEDLFAYYGASQLVRIDGDGSVQRMGSPAIMARFAPSPDGSLVLVEELEQPFSYLVPYYRFATRVVVRDTSGALVREVARLPLAENIPVGRNAVRTGRREIGWRADADATLYWVEAKDGGDPRAEVKYRDEVFTWRAPFASDPEPLVSLGYRFRDVYWGDDDVALVDEWWWSTRRRRLWRVTPGASDRPPVGVFDYSYEDRYHAPSSPLLKPTPQGT